MTYLGDGENSAVPQPADTQATLHLGTAVVTVMADLRRTGGGYSLYRLDLRPKAGGAAPHFHRTFAEAFSVRSGRPELFEGTAWVDVGVGDHLHVPAGGVHGFRNRTDERASMLMLSVPGTPREGYFTELAELAGTGRQLSPTEWAEFLAGHDPYMVPD